MTFFAFSASWAEMRNDKHVLLEHSFFCVKYSTGTLFAALFLFCDIISQTSYRLEIFIKAMKHFPRYIVLSENNLWVGWHFPPKKHPSCFQIYQYVPKYNDNFEINVTTERKNCNHLFLKYIFWKCYRLQGQVSQGVRWTFNGTFVHDSLHPGITIRSNGGLR